MSPNFHSILSDFFIKGHDLYYIAGTYETSWYEVAEILDSDLARRYMRAANRVQRIRAAGINLRSRLAAIKTLESTITQRDDRSHSSIEARRRAATAILNGARPSPQSRTTSTRAPRPKPTQPATTESLAPSASSRNRSSAHASADTPQSRSPASSSAKASVSRPTSSKPSRPNTDPKPASSASLPPTSDPSRQTKAASNTQPPRLPARAEKPRSIFKTRRARPKSNARAKPRQENSS